jgi:hypothetical protein
MLNTASVMVTAYSFICFTGMHLDAHVGFRRCSQSTGRLAASNQSEGRGRPGLRCVARIGSHGGFSAGLTAPENANHPTAGRIPGGATIDARPDRSLPVGRKSGLTKPDFNDALRISSAINGNFEHWRGLGQARSALTICRDMDAKLIAEIEALASRADAARVVINERTGTIGKRFEVLPSQS